MFYQKKESAFFSGRLPISIVFITYIPTKACQKSDRYLLLWL